jgi:hypothetical protein
MTATFGSSYHWLNFAFDISDRIGHHRLCHAAGQKPLGIIGILGWSMTISCPSEKIGHGTEKLGFTLTGSSEKTSLGSNHFRAVILTREIESSLDNVFAFR